MRGVVRLLNGVIEKCVMIWVVVELIVLLLMVLMRLQWLLTRARVVAA